MVNNCSKASYFHEPWSLPITNPKIFETIYVLDTVHFLDRRDIKSINFGKVAVNGKFYYIIINIESCPLQNRGLNLVIRYVSYNMQNSFETFPWNMYTIHWKFSLRDGLALQRSVLFYWMLFIDM